MRIVLYGSALLATLLAFAWPFAISVDRDDAAFKALAIGSTLLFFASLIACCAQRCKAPPTSS